MHSCGFAISLVGLTVSNAVCTPWITWRALAWSQLFWQAVCCRAHHHSGDNLSFNGVLSRSWLLSCKCVVTADTPSSGASPMACTRLAGAMQTCWEGLAMNTHSW